MNHLDLQKEFMAHIIFLREKGLSFEKIMQWCGYRKLGRKIIMAKKTA